MLIVYYCGGAGASPTNTIVVLLHELCLPPLFRRDTFQYDVLLIHKSNIGCKPSSAPSEYGPTSNNNHALLIDSVDWIDASFGLCSITIGCSSCYLSSSLLRSNMSLSFSSCYLFLYSSDIQNLSISRQFQSDNAFLNLGWEWIDPWASFWPFLFQTLN